MSRKTVSLRMPVTGHAAPAQALASIEEIDGAPRRAERGSQYPPGSAFDQWVRYGRTTDRGQAAVNVSSDRAHTDALEWDGDSKRYLALVGAIDDICRQRTKVRAEKGRDPRPVAANDQPGKPALILPAAGRQHVPARDDTAPGTDAPALTIDIEQLSKNVVHLVEQGGKAMAACLRPREVGRLNGAAIGDIIGIVRTFDHLAEYWFTHPHRAVAAQVNFGKAYFDLWVSAVGRMLGEQPDPVARSDPKDRRFAGPEWSSNPFFDVLKQAYLLAAQWTERLVKDARGIDAHTRRKAEFYVRQFIDALCPANFVLTNPELLRETVLSNAGNLARGMRMLGEDIEAGRGRLKIRHSDTAVFEVGRNLAITPGKVIYRNELMELIQYSPTTSTVLKRPLLIVPPWINKYYILDLTPEKSFVKWCVDQGLTVFVISWANPDATLASKGFDDYMREGALAALEVIGRVTGEETVHTMGYCVGGTLLAAMLAYLAAKGEARALSATLCAAQVDFANAGDILALIDEEQVEGIERQMSMSETGCLEGHSMTMAFNLLRSNDLIWPYAINTYLKGKAPRPFDLLHWNSDATRIPGACHSFYLRNCYLENKLAKGEMAVAGETIDLGSVTTPLYSLATREDHIAPAKSVFLGSKLFGGPVKFVVAASGHIAGVVNPPAQAKYSYWTDGPTVSNVETWLAKAQEHPGSWWPHWLQWIREQDPAVVPSRIPGGGKLEPLEDAPGRYVKVKD